MGRHVLLVHELLEPARHLLGQVIELLLSQRRLEARTHLGRGRRFERATEPGSLRATELNLFLVQVVGPLGLELVRDHLEKAAHLLRHDLIRVVGIQMAPERHDCVIRHCARTLFELMTDDVHQLVERDVTGACGSVPHAYARLEDAGSRRVQEGCAEEVHARAWV